MYCVCLMLFEIVLKVARDALVQVNLVAPVHVVALSGVEEEVGLCAGVFTCADKGKAMLMP